MKLELHASSTVWFKLCDQCRARPALFIAWCSVGEGMLAYKQLHFCSRECGEAHEVALALIGQNNEDAG